jgi:1,4-dihydroxy-2-naphthoate octaprenyltransferase
MLAASVPATLLTFNLLLLNEFPDLAADKRGNRRNLIHRFGRPAAGWIYVLAGVGVPLSIVAGWALGLFPAWALLGVLPSVILIRPAEWAIDRPESALPVELQRDNVLWILATNTVFALGLLLPALF